MFQMLTCFDLKPGVALADLERALDVFEADMQARDLIVRQGTVMQRDASSALDTDHERGHRYVFVTEFRDRAQSDAALAYLHGRPAESWPLHQAVFGKVRNTVFTAWQGPAVQ